MTGKLKLVQEMVRIKLSAWREVISVYGSDSPVVLVYIPLHKYYQ